MTCKGICPRYKASKQHGIGRYESGQKRCQVCEMFIYYDGLWCPCCGYRLRGKPRGSSQKAKFHQAQINGTVKKYGIITSMKEKDKA